MRENVNILLVRSSGGMLGAESVVINIARYAKEFAINCTIGVPVLKTDLEPDFINVATSNNIAVKVFKHDKIFDINLAKMIRKYVQIENFSLIHCHGYQEDFYAILSRVKKPLIATNHLWKRNTLKLLIYSYIDAWLYRYFDHIVAVSGKIHDELKKNGYRKKTSIISNGIDYDKFSAKVNDKEITRVKESLGVAKDVIIIGMVSSITIAKGHSTALKVLSRLIESGLHDVRLIIVGHGPQFESIKKQVESMKLDKYVIFTGRRSDVKNVLDIFDIYLMTSLKEGMPISLLEAMASGLPVVTSNVGDIKHAIVHNENGFIHETKDISGFESSILRLIKDKDLRLKIGISAQRTVKEKYSARTMAGNYCKLYRKIIAQAV